MKCGSTSKPLNLGKTKSKKFEEVDVFTFIGRMVQHIVPKGFQRVRYYGLQATRTFNKWAKAIRKGLQRIGRTIKGAYQVVIGRDIGNATKKSAAMLQ